MSFDEISDLTAGAYFYFYNVSTRVLCWWRSEGRQQTLRPAVLSANHYVLQTAVFDANGRLKMSREIPKE